MELKPSLPGAGCNVCTALVTVHRNDSRHGQVEKTIEYYTMGHLTKFVRPGAVRIASTASGSVPNVAWRNPNGGKVLIAYNDTAGSQALKVNWGGQSFTYTIPTKTSATFTWSGTPSGPGNPGGRTGQITGFGAKCVDVAGSSTANGTQVQLWTCNGTTAQRWTVGTDGTIRALGKCLDATGPSSADGTRLQIWTCFAGANQRWTLS